MTRRKIKIYQMKYIQKKDVHHIISNKEKHLKNFKKENEQFLSKLVSAEGFKTI